MPTSARALAALVPLFAACASDPAPLAAPARAAATERAPAPAALLAPANDEALEALRPLTGPWRVQLEAPGGELLARGEAAIAWSPSGRFLLWEASFELDGGASRSLGLLGHDALSNEYQWAWASGWSGRISLARGRGELSGAGLRLVADEKHPETGAPLRARSVMRLEGSGRIVIEQAVEVAPGEWQPSARTVYTRVAPPPADRSAQAPESDRR